MQRLKHFFLALVMLFPLGFVTATAQPWHHGSAGILGGKSNFVIEGYDPVAYFTQEKPVQGKKNISAKYKGGTFLFSSEEHKALFVKNPEKYAPQFGGHCAWAASQNYIASGDPEAWTVRNGLLYINYSKKVRNTWLKNVDENIEKGNKNWPTLRAKG